MPLDISADMWDAIRDRNRKFQIVVKIEWPNGTKVYGGKAGVYIADIGGTEPIIDRDELEGKY